MEIDELKKTEPTLKEVVLKLTEKLDEQGKKPKKPKPFKIPFKARISKMLGKKNYVTIIKLDENRNLSFSKQKIEDQTFMLDGVPRLASGEDVFNYNNKPVIIIPSWTVKPFTPSEHYQLSLTDGSNTVGYRLLMATMKAGILPKKKAISRGLLIGIGILVILGIVAYAIFGK